MSRHRIQGAGDLSSEAKVQGLTSEAEVKDLTTEVRAKGLTSKAKDLTSEAKVKGQSTRPRQRHETNEKSKRICWLIVSHASDGIAAGQIFFVFTQEFDKVLCYRRYYFRSQQWIDRS